MFKDFFVEEINFGEGIKGSNLTKNKLNLRINEKCYIFSKGLIFLRMKYLLCDF